MNRSRIDRGKFWPSALPVFLLLFLLLLVGCRANNVPPPALLSAPLGSSNGYDRIDSPIEWSFPDDHGPHPDFQTEWWYYTGNVQSAEGRKFGYQLTFFRRALLPPGERNVKRTSAWATDQVYMAHLALTDVQDGQFFAFERFSRGAANLAGAQSDPFSVWLEDWAVKAQGKDAYMLKAAQGDLVIELLLEDVKGPVLQGDGGFSQKGPKVGNASAYYSLTRLATDGRIELAGEAFQVSGSSWMDHEFSTSALSVGQVGWDWFSIQLDDETEIMVFQIRRDDGSRDPFSSGSLISTDGFVTPLTNGDFQIGILDTWHSTKTDTDYPSGWQISVPQLEIDLRVTPYLRSQELLLSFVYWEGAVGIEGVRAGRPVTGEGYVEMTGYAESYEGRF